MDYCIIGNKSFLIADNVAASTQEEVTRQAIKFNPRTIHLTDPQRKRDRESLKNVLHCPPGAYT